MKNTNKWILCNGPQRVGALVAKGGCIRLRADAKAVQHDQKYTLFHMFSLHFPPGCPGTVALLLTLIISKSRRLCKRFVVESFLFKPDEILAVSLQRFFLYCSISKKNLQRFTQSIFQLLFFLHPPLTYAIL